MFTNVVDFVGHTQEIDSSKLYQVCVDKGFNWRDGDMFEEAVNAILKAGFVIINPATGDELGPETLDESGG